LKNIYELLNDVDVDEKEFEEMEVTELYKAKIKRNVMESIKQKKKITGWKRNMAVAVILVGCSVTTLALTSPAYAYRIPVIGDIFRFLDHGSTGGLYDEYKDYSSVINTTEVSNGIAVTLTDAIYDGETVSVAYSLESGQDLGDTPYLSGLLDMKGADGGAGSNQISKVDENHYVGLMTFTDSGHKRQETINIIWNLESITNRDSKEKITGNWKFAVTLKAAESRTQLIDRYAEQEGIQVHIEKISFTPMSFIVYYGQAATEKVKNNWDGVDVDIEVKDDLGNLYSGRGNGGAGEQGGYKMNWSKTFEKLDKNATKLIVTPQIRLYDYTSDRHGALEITREGLESKEIPLPKKSGKGEEKFGLEDMTIELKK